MGWSSPQERAVAEKVVTILRSEKYKSKNYLFLAPFDLTQVPGYEELVGPPLDLKTVSERIDSYDSPGAFWKDVEAIFDKAIKYHAEKPTKWIAKFARDMKKALVKERKLAESPKPQPKPSKKLKLPTAAAAAAGDATTTSAANTKKTLKIKFSKVAKPKKDADSPSTAGSLVPTAKAKPTLKLKLSSSKKASETTSKPPKDSPPPSKPAKVSAPPPGNSRGKELPQGVVVAPTKSTAGNSKPTASSKSSSAKGSAVPKAPAKTTAKAPASSKAATAKGLTTTKSSATTKKSITKRKPKSSTSTSGASSGGGLDPATRRQCTKILLGLRRRKDASWFISPVSDKAILADYRARIKNPMDLTSIQAKLVSQYKNVSQFCFDVRTVFANALIYNTGLGPGSLRPRAIEFLEKGEELMKIFLNVPPLLYCWKHCIGIMNTLYNIQHDQQPAAYYFQHPVEFYFGGQHPPDYLNIIHQPMDFGTVTANLVTGVYTSVSQFANDCRLVIANCIQYHNATSEDSSTSVLPQANRLNSVLSTQLTQLERYDSKPRPPAPLKPPPPPPQEIMLSVLEDLRSLQYTDKTTRITEPAMGPFEEPVNLTVFTDYLQHVSEPMDLKTVEQTIKAATKYVTPEDFEYDMNLIWKNSLDYHQQRNDIHSVNMAKYAAKQFKRIWHSKINALEDPSVQAPPEKKIIPRISITAARLQKAQGQPSNQHQGSGAKPPTSTSNQPVPLHIAIAKVKEAFPLRRTHKSLQPWEADCARYFRELMKHPWLTITHPKFLFHVPVPTLFPDLRESYAAKIRKPMDLTTVDCSLLAGNKYAVPEDFVQDVALVFCNAIRFNKDGKDGGDPLSCAYYDASVHLLRYSRWLSLELLSHYVEESEVTDDGADGLPPFSWKLTDGNRKVSRKETEAIALKELLEKSLEGDRFTWMEAECEKLLKSDMRYMKFFLVPNFPADYAAFISKPMDWETVQKRLKKRQYDTIEQVVEDLRLIFSNAEKYNANYRGTDTESGRAYEAAKIMSTKLETAISKMLLAVSDRLERERIDHQQAEREVEAIDRAAEAEIRASWKKDSNESGEQSTSSQPRTVRTKVQRRQATDFEIPFFDEEGDGRRERSYVEVNKAQKLIFERHLSEKADRRVLAGKMTSVVISRLIELDKARKIAAAARHAKERASKGETMDIDQPTDVVQKEFGQVEKCPEPSALLSHLESDSRPRFQLKIAASKSKSGARKRKRAFAGFDTL